MKKYLIILLLTITFAILFALGIYIYQNNTANIKQNENVKLANYENQTNTIEFIATSTGEVKITPNATVIYQTKYTQCGHIIENKSTVEEDMVNLNENELKEKYNEYQIKKFDDKEIILYKEEKGLCKEHYVLRNYNGYIAIYNLEANGKENLVEVTSIVTNYLPEIDIERLDIGIRVNGKQELNATLEDYE